MYLNEKNKFLKNGYVVIDNFFQNDELQMIQEEISTEVNSLITRLYDKGLIKKDYSKDDNMTVDKRLMMAESDYIGTSIILHTTFAARLKRSFGQQLFSNERLLQLMATLLNSSDISGHPEWNLRCKTNSKYFTVPYHQDAAYGSKGIENYDQITVWISLVDITDENGPLQIISNDSGSSQEPLLFKHCLQKSLNNGENKDSWYLEVQESEIEKRIPNFKPITISPLPKGSIVCFTNKTLHRSLPNNSPDIRWTIDIRFMKSNDPTGFYPLDSDQTKSENKMNLTSSTEKLIPIDYNIWSPPNSNIEILMTSNNNNNQEEDDKLINYKIEGPWMDNHN